MVSIPSILASICTKSQLRWKYNLLISVVGTFKLLSKLIDNKGLSGTRRYFGDLGKTVSIK